MKTFLVLCFIICVNMLVWCDAGVKLTKSRRIGFPFGPNECARCTRCCKKPDACCSTLSTRFNTISEKLDEVLEKVSSCFPPEPACTEQEVVNPSFEESGGWTGGKAGLTFTSEAAFEGTRSLASCGGAEQHFEFAAGVRTVIASVYVKVDTMPEQVLPSLSCFFELQDGSETRFAEKSVSTVGDWTRIDIEVVSPKDLAGGRCVLANVCPGSSGQPAAFFDVFRLFTLTRTQDAAACREMFLPDPEARK